MPESAPTGFTENAAVGPSQALTPAAIAAVLADFHNWLTARAVLPAEQPATAVVPSSPDQYTLLAQMTALRHEVNLQTKAVRAQQEQTGQALQQLEQAVEMVGAEAAASNGEDAGEVHVRPLIKTLVDLFDALSLASREIARVKDSVLPNLEAALTADEDLPPEPEFPFPRQEGTWWRRWLGGKEVHDDDAWRGAVQSYQTACRKRDQRAREMQMKQREAAFHQMRQALVSLVTGYAMGLERIERSLRQHGLEPIPTVGQPFEPDEMEVIEAVPDSGYLAGEVVGEVRRGYRWNGRVFRCAQVRVARS
jgi:molecular chaperone GrpE